MLLYYSLTKYTSNKLSLKLAKRQSQSSFLVLHVEVRAHDTVVLLRWRVVQDTSPCSLRLHGFFFVLHGFFKDLFFGVEFDILVDFEVVAFEQTTDAQSDFSLAPFTLEAWHLGLDLFEASSTILDHSFDEFFVHLFGPVVAFLNIEVLEVEGAVFEEDVLVRVHERLSHLDDVVSLGVVEFVVDGPNSLVLLFGQQVLLRLLFGGV